MSEVAEFSIAVERKQTLLCEPHLVSFSHILEHLPATEAMEKRGIIACTNGKQVYYGKKYLALSTAERSYIHVHELSHGIFMHADRAQLLRLLKGTLNPALFNYAGDAIINEGIEANSAMPSGMFSPPKAFPPVKMDFIHKAMAEAISFSGEKPPSNYDPKAVGGMQVEVIYDWLVWALDAVQRKREEMAKDCPRAKQKQEERKKDKNKKDGDKPEDAQNGDQPGDDGKGDDEGDGQDGNQPGNGNDGDQPGDANDGNQSGEGSSEKCDPKGKPSNKPCTCGQCDQEGEGQGNGGEGEGDGDGMPSNAALGGGNQGLTQIERMAEDEAWDLEEQLGRLKELLDEGRTTTELIDEINGRMNDSRVMIEQIVQGLKLQGTGQGSLILELAGDLPKAVVPWERYIRRVTTRGLGTKLNDSYVRKGVPTMTALARRDRAIPHSPGTTIFTERPRLLVILDVSGSHIGMLPVCFSEIWSIAQKKGAVVEVMTFDDGVQEVIEIKNKQDFKQVMRQGLRGGGGTSLQGVWDRITKMRDPYRMCIVMTDGYLDAGAKPKIPVVWLVTPGGRGEFGYGEEIYLPEIMAEANRKKAA